MKFYQHISTLMDALRNERVAQQYSQDTIGRIAGYNHRQISAWERGEHRPSDHAITHMAQALGCHFELVPNNEHIDT